MKAWLAWWLVLLFATCAVAHLCVQDRVYSTNIKRNTGQTYDANYPTDNNTRPIRLRADASYLDNDSLGMTCTRAGEVIQALRDSTSTSTFSYTCTQADVITPSLRQYLGSLLNSAQELFQGTLKVVPVLDRLVLQGSSNPQGLYGGVYLSNEYTNGVPNLDVVIFVTARPILSAGSSTTQTLAVARVVQEDQYGRPVFGHLNINPAGIDTNAVAYNRNFGVVIHEMTHSLGFNIQKFRRINPLPGQPSDITREVTLNVGANDLPTSRTIIASPRVIEWAKRYYNCPNVIGIELENQGGGGTELSHWEKRVVLNEYMTGTASQNPVFSELTLAVLEDTGWYRANYSRAGMLLWGQGMGCDFINRGCNNWPTSYNGYFCTTDGASGCTADYHAKGQCALSGYSGLPPMYQYFSDPTRAGFYDLPDYCPITWGLDNQWCFDPKAASTSIVDMGESFSQQARCFSSSLAKGLQLSGPTSPGCYETFCLGPKDLRVKIGGYWYQCPAGSDIKIIGFGGTLSCPRRIEQVCGTINGTLSGSVNGTYPTGPNGEDLSNWPSFLTISPNAGGPGLRVTITGLNFVGGMQVLIGDPLIDVVTESATVITAVIPKSNRFKNPTNIIEQKESVIVIDPKGRSSVGYDKFTIKVKLNRAFLENAAAYLRDNWLVTAAIVVAIVVTCLVCGYCCYRQKGKAKEADTEYYDG